MLSTRKIAEGGTAPAVSLSSQGGAVCRRGLPDETHARARARMRVKDHADARVARVWFSSGAEHRAERGAPGNARARVCRLPDLRVCNADVWSDLLEAKPGSDDILRHFVPQNVTHLFP